MPQPAVLPVTLSQENLDLVRELIASGEHRSEDDVIAALLEDRREMDRERIRFEQEEVLPAHDEYMADPSSAIPLEQARRNLQARRQQFEAS